MLLTAVIPEIRLALQTTGTEDDIEAQLDESYKRILRDNRRSEVMKGLAKVLYDLLAHAAAKNGIKLP